MHICSLGEPWLPPEGEQVSDTSSQAGCYISDTPDAT
jgi:hypothetical protein